MKNYNIENLYKYKDRKLLKAMSKGELSTLIIQLIDELYFMAGKLNHIEELKDE